MNRLPRSLLPLITLALAVPIAAKDKDTPDASPPLVFQAVLDCKNVVDAGERLACYDRTVGAMATAREARDLVIADRATIQAKQQDSFGLKDKPVAADDRVALTAQIASVNFEPGNGTAVIVLDSGQVWRTTSNGTLIDRLRAGQQVQITPSGLFGYRLKIEGRTGFQGVTRIR